MHLCKGEATCAGNPERVRAKTVWIPAFVAGIYLGGFGSLRKGMMNGTDSLYC